MKAFSMWQHRNSVVKKFCFTGWWSWSLVLFVVSICMVNYQLTLVNNGLLIIKKQCSVLILSMCTVKRVWKMAAGGEELWRECASWLTRCGLLRPDHKANWDTSTIHDLAYILRDGVLLCNLLNVLHPGCIDMKDVNQRPQMAQVSLIALAATFALITYKPISLRTSYTRNKYIYLIIL